MIAKLESTQSNAYQNKTNTEPSPTMGSALNNRSTTTEPRPYNGQQFKLRKLFYNMHGQLPSGTKGIILA